MSRRSAPPPYNRYVPEYPSRTRPDERSITPFNFVPKTCDLSRSRCPDHKEAYRELLKHLKDLLVKGYEDIEYIYNEHRFPDRWADVVIDDLEKHHVFRGYLVHYGILEGPGFMPNERPHRRDHGNRETVGRHGMRGMPADDGRPSRRGGRMAQMMEDDRESRASWGRVSKPSSRAPTVAGSVRSGRGSRH